MSEDLSASRYVVADTWRPIRGGRCEAADARRPMRGGKGAGSWTPSSRWRLAFSSDWAALFG
ncbi:MAG: hypothetical protein ACO3FE_19430 [Planctomycetaceae bacterium]